MLEDGGRDGEARCGCEADGECGAEWDRASAVRNQFLMGAPVAVGVYAMAKHRPSKLLLYLPALVMFVTLWRRFICARCRYYGMECSTMLGVLTARIMPRDVSKALGRRAMTADFAYIAALAALPLPEVFRSAGLAALYLLSNAAGMAAILEGACGRCGNDFCPMKDLHGKLHGRNG